MRMCASFLVIHYKKLKNSRTGEEETYMIKLVASDMDGTILNDRKELSATIKDTIRQLQEKGIRFVPASGRNSDTLKDMFSPLQIATVADNGGTAYDENGELLYVAGIPLEDVLPVMKEAEKMPWAHLVICGVNHVYVLKDNQPDVKDFVDLNFPGLVHFIDDIREAFAEDQIVKVSFTTPRDGSREVETQKRLQEFDRFRVCLSGDGWVDMLRNDVSKGRTLRKLCEHYAIGQEEVMAFGDYVNDIEMLSSVKHSYAMANAHPDILALCANKTKYTNEEDGVSRELARIFNLELKEED